MTGQIASWQANGCTHDTSKKYFRNDLTTEELSITGQFCDEFSFRARKQRNKKDDTARKKIVTKSFTNSLKNGPRTDNQEFQTW